MNRLDKNEDNNIEINEMFMAQADNDRCFYGIIKRSKDSYGNPHLFSRIVINDGIIQACDSDQKMLGKMLDEMCILVLDMGLHSDAGISIEIFGSEFFLN